MALGIVISGLAADRFGRRPVLLSGQVAVFGLGFLMGPMLAAGASTGDWVPVLGFLCISLLIMGWIFGPVGAVLPELFPTRVRYTGASLTYNLAGILGASGAPYLAQELVALGGIGYVGFYIATAAVLSFVSVAGDAGDRRPRGAALTRRLGRSCRRRARTVAGTGSADGVRRRSRSTPVPGAGAGPARRLDPRILDVSLIRACRGAGQGGARTPPRSPPRRTDCPRSWAVARGRARGVSGGGLGGAWVGRGLGATSGSASRGGAGGSASGAWISA